jgi:hypothetical protein
MGFTIVNEFDDLTDADGTPAPGGHAGFVANGPRWSVDVSAFGQSAADGHYMAVIVEPRSG